MKPGSLSDTREYAKRRAAETGRMYSVWTVADRADLWWSAFFCQANDDVYRRCGATRREDYAPPVRYATPTAPIMSQAVMGFDR